MSEQRDVMERLRDSGVIGGIEWAYRSATSRVLSDHSEDAGYNSRSLGFNRFILFLDRLDRVFSCGKYALDEGADPTRGLDLLHAELPKADIRTMPNLSPNLIRPANVSQSPGWAFKDLRFLLASSDFGKIDRLPWGTRSKTMQRIAAQPSPEPEPSLFDDLDPQEVPGLIELSKAQLDLDTFVVAHSLDPVTHNVELAIGRPRYNNGGGSSWHWLEDLLDARPTTGGHRIETVAPTGPDTVEDAPVRLRPAAQRAPKTGEQS